MREFSSLGAQITKDAPQKLYKKTAPNRWTNNAQSLDTWDVKDADGVLPVHMFSYDPVVHPEWPRETSLSSYGEAGLPRTHALVFTVADRTELLHCTKLAKKMENTRIYFLHKDRFRVDNVRSFCDAKQLKAQILRDIFQQVCARSVDLV